jgi:iron complex transport system substrate-binding protein
MAVAMLAGLASGCGSSSDLASAFPVTLTGKLGTVVIRSAPKRVVTLGDVETDTALALGVTPVGVAADPYGSAGVSVWDAGRLGMVHETVLYPDGLDEFNLQQIAALHPDLILAPSDFGLSQQYAELSKIAPTVGFKTGWRSDSWQSQAILTGEALGKKAKATALVDMVTAAVANFRRAHPGLAGKTYTFSELASPTQIATIVSPTDRASSLFTQLGMHVPVALQKAQSNVLEGTAVGISLENLAEINADMVFITALTPDAGAVVKQIPNFSSLPAVKGGDYQVLDPELAFALRTPTPLSLSWALHQISPALAKVAGQ